MSSSGAGSVMIAVAIVVSSVGLSTALRDTMEQQTEAMKEQNEILTQFLKNAQPQITAETVLKPEAPEALAAPQIHMKLTN